MERPTGNGVAPGATYNAANQPLYDARRNLVLVLADQGRPGDAAKALEDAIQATGPQPQYQGLSVEISAHAAH